MATSAGGGDTELEPASHTFLVMVTGQLETAEFPEYNEIYAKYFYVMGKDWKLVTGTDQGISQTACCSFSNDNTFALNFPIEVTFQSTTPHGWPQLVVTIFGKEPQGGRNVVVGYGATHVPLVPGRKKSCMAIFAPAHTSGIQEWLYKLTRRCVEFNNPSIVAENEGREVIRVKTRGHLWVAFQVVTKDFQKVGFDISPSDLINPSYPNHVNTDPST